MKNKIWANTNALELKFGVEVGWSLELELSMVSEIKQSHQTSLLFTVRMVATGTGLAPSLPVSVANLEKAAVSCWNSGSSLDSLLLASEDSLIGWSLIDGLSIGWSSIGSEVSLSSSVWFLNFSVSFGFSIP
jgi:hypothetical protein